VSAGRAPENGDADPVVGAFSRVLVVDDEQPVRHMLELILGREGFSVHSCASAEEALDVLAREPVDVMLSDVRMPGLGGLGLVERASASHPALTILVMSAFGSVELALEAMKRGAYDYVAKPFKQDEVLLALRKAEERERLRRENADLRARLRELSDEGEFLGDMLIHSEGMRAVARTVRKVAGFKTTVLVLGESGVGKELVARAVHRFSPRAGGPVVAVNCGAIPESLLESELFGHVRGAFTDALTDKQGLFEQARGGTLFLDEVGEMAPALQVKLLRALQEEAIRRVGDTREIAVDVRVVAATSRPLEQMVEEGSFRSDLYYRLNVMPIEVPPLRERRDDIPPLVAHFLARINQRLGTSVEGVTPAALRVLVAYDWPGNVRELENTLEHAAVLTEGPGIDVAALPERVTRGGTGGPTEGVSLRLGAGDLSVKRAQRALERELILRALEQTGGNRTQAARLLELSHRALLYKIKEFGLS
jgi:two-component system response regulator AtoC